MRDKIVGKEISNIIDKFVSECEEVKKSYIIPGTTIGLSELHGKIKHRLGRSRYNGYLAWYHIDLNENIVLKKEYEDACAIHIKPYCIKETDVEKALSSQKCKFAMEIEKDLSFVDYDPQTGNYHKVANGEYQCVIIKKIKAGKRIRYGPGWLNGTIESFNNKWYYPKLCDNKNYDNVKALLDDVFNSILQKEKLSEKID